MPKENRAVVTSYFVFVIAALLTYLVGLLLRERNMLADFGIYDVEKSLVNYLNAKSDFVVIAEGVNVLPLAMVALVPTFLEAHAATIVYDIQN